MRAFLLSRWVLGFVGSAGAVMLAALSGNAPVLRARAASSDQVASAVLGLTNSRAAAARLAPDPVTSDNLAPLPPLLDHTPAPSANPPGGATLQAGGTRQQIVAAFNGGGSPAALCRQAVAGRFPFSQRSGTDVPLDDFARLFGPDGLIDGFFNTQLQPFVDTSGPVWKAREGVEPAPVSPAELAPFQRAAMIRDVFFGAGAQASFHFEIMPVDLDPADKQVTLEVGTGPIVYAHGAMKAVSVSWPTQDGGGAQLVFDPPAGGPVVLRASGPWALFRLFAKGTLAQEAPDRFTLTFRQGAHNVVFTIRAASVVNPWSSTVLADFKCPVLH